MKSLIGLFIVFFSFQAFAANPCENYAKAAAIRAYKASSGTIQGSHGIEYWAVKEEGFNNPYLYTVTISDNNEDEEYWELDYLVRVLQTAKGCKILSVKKDASRD